MTSDTATAVELARAAHARLAATAEGTTDEQAHSPSRLPGWTVAHVLTHLARNADGHVHRLEGALRGEDLPRYPGGLAQRNGEIEEGSRRSAEELAADIQATARRLEAVWEQSAAAGWPHADLLGDDSWPTTESPWRRLREVEIHHVDLGLGYELSDWPEAYLSWELPTILATVPRRVRRPEDVRALVAWVSGRGPTPEVDLAPW